MTQHNAFHGKTMLVSVTIRKPTKSRQDKRVTREAARQNNADEQRAGKFQKTILPKELMKKIDSIGNKTRNKANEYCIPFQHGAWMLPIENYPQWKEICETGTAEMNDWLNSQDFADLHSAYVKDNVTRLGDMNNINEVVSLSEIKAKTRIEFHASPFPENCNSWLTNLIDENADEIRQVMADQQAEAIASVKRSVMARIAKPVRHMAEALSEYRPATEDKRAVKAFHASVVTNIEDMIKLIPSFNVTGDDELNRLASELRELVQFDEKELKASDNIREQVQQKAEDIADRMSQFL